jgi:UDP-2,3-diacylglucosamine hydrolase
MSPTLFISDLHLSPARRPMVAAFHAFIGGPARRAAALYVLGDFFDVWLGDDQLREPIAAAVAAALAELSASGVPVFLQCGNRDFLLGERFAQACRAKLLPDTAVHDLYGTPTLVMHGDLLCTDDVEYQRFRAYWKDPVRRRRLLARPYFVRRIIAAVMRFGSRRATAAKREEIMDVNTGAVVAAMREHGVTRLIHGHTHRPAARLTVDGRPASGRWPTGIAWRVTQSSPTASRTPFDRSGANLFARLTAPE